MKSDLKDLAAQNSAPAIRTKFFDLIRERFLRNLSEQPSLSVRVLLVELLLSQRQLQQNRLLRKQPKSRKKKSRLMTSVWIEPMAQSCCVRWLKATSVRSQPYLNLATGETNAGLVALKGEGCNHSKLCRPHAYCQNHVRIILYFTL